MAKNFSIKVEGLKDLEQRFDGITPEVAKRVKRAINAGALKIQKDIIGALDSSSSGRKYKRGKKGDKIHTASKPGSAPNNDFGNLKKNIIVTTGTGLVTKGYFALVRSRAKYSRALEEGTKNMARRPFMGRAFRKNIKGIKLSIERAKNNAIKKHNK